MRNFNILRNNPETLAIFTDFLLSIDYNLTCVNGTIGPVFTPFVSRKSPATRVLFSIAQLRFWGPNQTSIFGITLHANHQKSFIASPKWNAVKSALVKLADAYPTDLVKSSLPKKQCWQTCFASFSQYQLLYFEYECFLKSVAEPSMILLWFPIYIECNRRGCIYPFNHIIFDLFLLLSSLRQNFVTLLSERIYTLI